MNGAVTDRDMYLFLHAYDHTLMRNGNPLPGSAALVHLCWGYPAGDPPAWATELADTNAPAAQWCPVINPALMNRGDE